MRPVLQTWSLAFGLAALALLFRAEAVLASWEPTRPVELIVPAGTGGGADQMARVIQGIVAKHGLMKQPLVVVNKAAVAGGEGLLDLKNARGNPHKLILTLSNLFTTSIGAGLPFSWRDLTPVAMMALDRFVLWVHADSPFLTAEDFIEAARAAPPEAPLKMGGTGLKQEDQLIVVALQKSAGITLTYLPYRGGGEVAIQLAGKYIDATVNNPLEAVAQWRRGQVRPLCVFDSKPLDHPEKIAGDKAWSDIPTCRSQGLDMTYLMLRGILIAPGTTPDQLAFYTDLLERVRGTPEWQALMRDGAFDQTVMVGPEFSSWLEAEDARYRELMREAGFLPVE